MNDSLKTPARSPSWASFFTAEQFAIFQILVEAALAPRGFSGDVFEGTVQARSDAGHCCRLGLQNLAQRCLRHGEVEWGRVIDEHFANVLAGLGRERDKNEPFAALKHQLKVRLYADDFPDSVRLIHRFVAPGVTAVLTRDLPDAVVTVSPETAEAWGLSELELMSLGMTNALAEPFEQGQFEVGGASVQILAGDSFFVATQALNLGARVPTGHPHGALVAIPNRHTVLFHVIEGPEMCHAVRGLLICAREQFREGPGSISRDLFWWRDDSFTLLPSSEKEGTLEFSPPAEFSGCVERLAQARS